MDRLKLMHFEFSFFRQTYVVANIGIFYSESKRAEILYLQDYVTSTGKLFFLNVSKSTVEAVGSKQVLFCISLHSFFC